MLGNRGLMRSGSHVAILFISVLSASLAGCGGGGGYGGGDGGGGGSLPSAASGLAATAGNGQVSLTWNAGAGATSYYVKRATISGGPYSQVAAPTSTNYTDTGLTNGTTYYYVVASVNSTGESDNSNEASAKPTAPATAVQVNVDVLTNRHAISPFVYGVSFPKDTNAITDSGTTFVRWGGNAASRYNWKLHTYNSGHDYYYEDFTFGALNNPADSDSEQFVRDVTAAGSNPLMTMVMLPWVAKSAETPPPTPNGHWSFSVAKYGAQCAVDPFNSDAGNGFSSNCSNSNPTRVVGNDPNDANVPIKDTNSGGDPAGTVYRSEWATALAGNFGSAPHFYDMDNEIDIWGGSHRDVHPNPATEAELRDTYLAEARALRSWDPQAVRFGPVSCCWYFYWNSDAGNVDKSSHGGVDFLPWWLNEVYWSDVVAGARSLEVFDFHAYPDGPDTTNFTQAQKQALALRIFRDYWDPTYLTEAWFLNNNVMTTDPLYNIPFRLPRMRAIVNTNYPGTPLAVTEWNAAFAGESDFSTALADADAYGILGRERLYAAARWTAPDSSTPAYQALKLYRNYDRARHGFGSLSVSATHNADPNLFSSYAALDSTGTTLTIVVINKDPVNAAQVQFALNGFAPLMFNSYTISQSSPNSIVAAAQQAWVSTQTFAPYTATLLVIGGTSSAPSAEWDLNPESVMVAAGGTVTLAPKLTSGIGDVTLSAPVFDSGITSMTISAATVSSAQNGAITVKAGGTPGFFHFTVTGTDGGGVVQKQGGWIVVNNPAATLTKQGDGQSGARGTTLALSVTLSPGQSGGSATGASILFTTDSGSISPRIVPTDSSGKASVTLTLPALPGLVHVTAEGPYGLGHPMVTFTETSQ